MKHDPTILKTLLGRPTPEQAEAISLRRARVREMAPTMTAREIAEELGVALGTVTNDITWCGGKAKIKTRKGFLGAAALSEASADPNNTARARMTVAERADYDAAYRSQEPQPHKAALIAAQRSDLITPDPPRLTAKGAYDPADLLRYFAEAHRRGMKADAIARALKVKDLSRIHYFMGRDGKRILEREAAKSQ